MIAGHLHPSSPLPRLHTDAARTAHAELPGVVRVVNLSDCRLEQRLTWLNTWLTIGQIFDYDTENTKLLSQFYGKFDSLLIHGEDMFQMARIIRHWRTIFQNKAILAAMPEPLARDRAELIKAGADTVLECHAAPTLAAATTNAILRRYQASRKIWLEKPIASSAASTRKKLSPSETIILNAIMERNGAPVQHDVILAKLGKVSTPSSFRTLRVQIYRLNSKLIALQIKTLWKTGLVLEPVGHKGEDPGN